MSPPGKDVLGIALLLGADNGGWNGDAAWANPLRPDPTPETPDTLPAIVVAAPVLLLLVRTASAAADAGRLWPAQLR